MRRGSGDVSQQRFGMIDTRLIAVAAAAGPAMCVRASQLLVKDVSSRMRLEDVAEHPWIKANADPAMLSMDAQDKGRSSAGVAAAAAAAAGAAAGAL